MCEKLDLGAIGQFQRMLNTYLKYREEFRRDSDLLTVSFLCMSDGQKNEMAELTGLVAV